jgi:flagellar basal-body rod protein FlgG
MAAQQTNIDVIANNLANVNTTGYKASRGDFQDLLYQTTQAAGTVAGEGAQLPTGIQIGLGTRCAAIQKMFSMGDLKQTGNALDLAIEGDGFFCLMTPDGTTAYTRDGTFKLDGSGRIVNSDGYALDPELSIPTESESISVGRDGTVSVTLPGQAEPQQIGQLQLARFLNPGGLASGGHNSFFATAASGDALLGTGGASGFGGVTQGFVEMSNVRIIDEMVNLIVAQRAYEVNSKAIQASDEMLQMANNLRR